MKSEINVAIVGSQFMGKAHSNAYLKVGHYFDLPQRPVMQAACSIDEASLKTFSAQFGWQSTETDYRKLVQRDDIDLIDICTPNNTHQPIAEAAAKAGKHIICEKPMARTSEEAKQMYRVAREAGVNAMMIFNYRFVPALALAKRLIMEGKLGEIRHFNAVYYQDWLVDPDFPIVWRHSADVSGSGAHGDMNAHIVDLARHLVGEIDAVCGEQRVFVKERPIANSSERGNVTADDAATFMARFQNGALGTFCATRMATGKKNFMRLEIFGSKGAVTFNLERLNELEYYSQDDNSDLAGFRTIMVTENTHPYINAWWPPGHIIGWEHTFIHEFSEMFRAIGAGKHGKPDFYDGVKCQLVLDAVGQSSNSGKWEKIEEFDEN